MIKTFYKIGIFLLLLFVMALALDKLIDAQLRKSRYVYFYAWNDAFNGKINDDVLVYGSSRARKQVNPKVFEENTTSTMYNLGLDGQTVTLQKAMQDVYFGHNKIPKLILYVVDEFTMAKDEFMFNTEQVLPYLNDTIIKNASREYKSLNFFDYNLPLVRYAGRREILKEVFNTLLHNSKQANKEYKGFTFNDRKLVVKGNNNAVMKDTVKIVPKFAKDFIQMIDDVQKKNIQLVFIIPPMHHLSWDYYAYHPQFMQFMDSVAKQKNIPILNYHNHEFTKIDSLFADAQHVNIPGAKFFTELIVKDLKEMDLVK